MRRFLQIIGLGMAIDGFLTTTFSRDFIKINQTDRFGPGYQRFVKSFMRLPDRTIRLIGLSLTLTGAATALLSRTAAPRPEAKRQPKMKYEVKEKVAGQEAVDFLRGLADSMEKSEDFQVDIMGKAVTIHPNNEIKVEYEPKEKGGELELEIKWKSA